MKKIETIVQSITPARPENALSFSEVIVLKHDEQSLKLQHGDLYVVYDLSCSTEVDTSFVSKVVQDVIHNFYYSSQSASPVHPLEKSALELKENLVQLTKEQNIDFSIAMAVIWDDILYIVSYGKNVLYILRDGNLKPIETTSEGNFYIAAGKVKDSDIVFISTKSFEKQFSPQQIFQSSKPLMQSDLNIRSSAFILKIKVNEELPIDIEDDILMSRALNIKKESDKKSYKIKKSLLKLKPKNNPKKKLTFFFAFLFLIAGFSYSVYVLAQNNKNKEKQQKVESLLDRAKNLLNKQNLSEEEKQELKHVESEITKEASESTQVKGISKKIEEALNLKKVNSELFYDLLVADKNVKPSQITYGKNNLFVSDKTNGGLYISQTDTAKFVKQVGLFENLNNINVEYDASDVPTHLVFTDSMSYKGFNISKKIIDQNFKLDQANAVFPYLGFIYQIKDNQIIKYTKGKNDVLTQSVWVTDDILKNAVSFTIDASIFVLNSDGSLHKFTSGKKDTFELKGLDVALVQPSRLYTNTFIDNLYILDKGNNRIVVINKKGEFLNQYVDIEDKWDNILDIAVSDDEKVLYILNGTKVFEVKL